MAKLKWGILALALACAFWLGFSKPANASTLALQTSRIFGERQIDTAIEVSKTGWQHADTVILANCDHFPDALVAAPLSHQVDAPILLTSKKGVDAKVQQEIQRLGAQQAIILGGEAALSSQVETDLSNLGIGKTERIAGYDQYETSQKVAERVGAKGQVILANGDQFPDALSISAYAGATETPILLTKAQTMPSSIQQELDTLQQKGSLNTIVVGGDAVISDATLSSLQNVQRLAGNDRYDTAAAVYTFAQDRLPARTIYVVTGEQFPDALAAGGLAAKRNSEIVMSKKTTLPSSIYTLLTAPTANLESAVLIGGTAVVTDQVKAILEGSSLPSSGSLEGLTIVVDPGHGGPDTGAIGPGGSYEKNNTLAMGLDLADLLRSAGAQVIMTRSTDVSPATGTYSELSDLQARTQIANSAQADLFICIHNDSFTNPAAGGTTTYYSSDSPVAAQSKALADSIQSELVKAISLQDRGTKDAAFYVIKHTDMPAVLIEVGFISNPTEEELLGSADFQQQVASGIYQGILNFKGNTNN